MQIFYVRGGRIRGQRGWVADRVDEGGAAELVDDFLLQLYAGGDRTPSRARSWSRRCRPTTTYEQLLGDLRGSPGLDPGAAAGTSLALQETVAQNAGQALALPKTRRASDLTTRNRALEEIQEALGLDEVPLRIECYDISTCRGTEVVVASMVVFEDGLARKSEYRRFVIRGVDGQNDIASMHEVITRRFKRLLDEQATSRSWSPTTARCWSTPRPGGPAGSPTRSAWSSSTAVHRRAAAQRALEGSGSSTSPVRAGQTTGGGVAAGPGGPGDPAAVQRGPLPPAADPGRGAPLRHHPPPLASVQVDGGERARRRTRLGEVRRRRCSSTSGR